MRLTAIVRCALARPAGRLPGMIAAVVDTTYELNICKGKPEFGQPPDPRSTTTSYQCGLRASGPQ